jgi:hypothetical protein
LSVFGWLRKQTEAGAADGDFRAALAERWTAYGDEVRQVAPSRIRTGTVDGVEYTAFDAMIMAGGLRARRESVRTIGMVHSDGHQPGAHRAEVPTRDAGEVRDVIEDFGVAGSR